MKSTDSIYTIARFLPFISLVLGILVGIVYVAEFDLKQGILVEPCWDVGIRFIQLTRNIIESKK